MAIRVESSAPSNIALIKYMGKSTVAANLPANPSLSYTLEHLRTFVTLEESSEGLDRWEPLPGYAPLNLTDKGRAKFLNHLARLKDAWRVPGQFIVRSANNFPMDCGLASSASSFAALTLAVHQAAVQNGAAELDPGVISRWSRLGSGSSCRSLFSPWALWRGEGAEGMIGLPEILDHAVVLVAEGAKEVSSSEAHQRTVTSPLYRGRADRAEARLTELAQALRSGHWGMAFELCWAEFEDMHALFESSRPAFSYKTAETRAVLAQFRALWAEIGDGPLITMDAGANIHLLFRPEQRAQATIWLKDLKYLSSWTTA